MPQVYRDLRLDVTRADYQNIGVNAKQYDSQSRFLRVTITNGGVTVPIPQGTQVVIGARRADGTSNAFLGSVEEDGNVIVPLAAWMLEQDGRVECSVTTVDTDGRRLATLRFYVVVQGAEFSGADIDEDENYDILVDLLEEVAQYSVAEAGRVEAEEARVLAESGRVSAEEGRVLAEEGRVRAEEGRVDAEAAREAKWNNASASATTLAPGSPATVQVEQSTNEIAFAFGIPQGEKGDQGDKGDTGATGATGNGIASIAKTSTSGLVDTYTITFTNGTTTTFDVENGKGISYIAKTFTSGLIDTYTIYYTDGSSTTFTVTNGTPAGFGIPTISVDGNVGVPYAEVTASGPATATVFAFAFHNLKGDKGDKGNTNFATFEIDPADGNLYMTTDAEYTGANFEINAEGYLAVIV